MPWRLAACRLVLWCLAALAVLPLPALAQGIESVLSPGRLSQAHAKLEDQCNQCHVRFDRAAQDRLCMDCHKDIARDITGKAGMHGRLKPQACRSCHTDHKGRQARMVAFDPARFDHSQTDFQLRGAHGRVECTSCHQPARKYRDAPHECNACHGKDDVHKGALGPLCAGCHNDTRWKDSTFDHGKTAFALTGRHVQASCTACHQAGRYKDTPRACVACHRKDDDARGHKGQFGEKCETCHGTQRWKPSVFNHDSDTTFLLRGKHRSVRCTDCHTTPLYKSHLPQACVDCHRKDDRHKETLGRDCASCHTERDWKERARFDHDKTSFPLLGKHVQAACQACHTGTMFKEAPKDCVACHRKDDRHAGTLGEKCADCHQERDWKTTQGRFDHARTRFALRDGHASPPLRCTACHQDARSMRHTPTDCVNCHRKDDRHEGQQGAQCEQCHHARSWKAARFDHARTGFPLVGRHLAVECKSCHASPRFKDAPRECVACHRKDDRHAMSLSERCASCHTTRGWALWEFDHDRRSSFRLEGAHRQVACARCHREPAPAGRPVAPTGGACIACHRKDDVHDGAFGSRCDRCHSVDTWKQIRNQPGAASAPRPKGAP
jgi:hypothetical protein